VGSWRLLAIEETTGSHYKGDSSVIGKLVAFVIGEKAGNSLFTQIRRNRADSWVCQLEAALSRCVAVGSVSALDIAGIMFLPDRRCEK
jgi:hypothetical protein